MIRTLTILGHMLGHVKEHLLLSRLLFSVVFSFWCTAALACVWDGADEILQLKCNLKFVAGKVITSDAVDGINAALSRNGYSPLTDSPKSVYYDRSISVRPTVSYDANINGGNAPRNFQVGDLEFISDPQYFRKSGYLVGADILANLRIASVSGSVLDFDLNYSKSQATNHAKLSLQQSQIAACFSKQISSWNIGKFCTSFLKERRQLIESSVSQISFSQNIYGDDQHATILHGYEISLDNGGYDFVRASLIRSTVDFNGQGQNITFSIGKSLTRSTVEEYSVSIQRTLDYNLINTVGVKLKHSQLEPLLGLSRSDTRLTIESSIKLNQLASLSFGYVKSESSIDYFDDEYQTAAIKFIF